MNGFLLAVAVLATIAITLAVDEECIQRKIRGLPVHWPNPTDCSSFYRCTNKNIKRELLCPEGKEYNPKTGRCANKGKNLCQLSLVAPLTAATNNICADEISGNCVPNSESCRSFYICNNKLAYPQNCDAGSYFNETLSACQPDKETLCWENLCMKKLNGDFVVNVKDCHGFFICNDEKTVPQKCPEGSYFSEEALNCQPGGCPSDETTTCTPEITTTCAPETTTRCTAEITTTTTCTPETTTICTPETTTTCTPETTTTCTPETTTTCTPETTTTCTPETTTTCTPKITTTTTCTPATTTITTCVTETTCAAETTTTCSAKPTTTTTCSPQETTTPVGDDCSNTNCDSSKCQNAKDGLVFSADNTNAGFCICLKQSAEYRKCPDDAIFNESLKICVAQDKVCSSLKCYEFPDYTTFPASNTTAGFCRCLKGEASYFDCPGTNYVFNEKLGLCEESANSKEESTISANELCNEHYTEGEFVANPNNCMLFYICYEGKLVEGNCEAGNYFNQNVKACLLDSERTCPETQLARVNFNGRRNKRSIKCVENAITPAADCDKFYKCSKGQNLLYGCGKNNIFNLTTLTCQLDVQHLCWPINSCTEGEKLPYPNDNQKYYECADGKLVVNSCEQYRIFNKLSMSCVAKEECTCPGGYKENEISAHPDECDKFYMCIAGDQVLHECGKGNYFAKETLSCKMDDENKCKIEKPCQCPGGYDNGDLSPHPDDCDKYFICENGQQILHECGENNYFKESTLTCEPDIYNECWTKAACTCPGGYKEGDFSMHPTDCSKYYICHDGHQVLKDCGTNNFFNNKTLTCNLDTYNVCWPNLCAGQSNGALVTNPQQCNTFFICENGEAIPKTCLDGQWFNPSENACVADVDAECYNPCANETASPVVLLPHPICNKYYFCNGRRTFVGTCQVGSFDIETGVCNDTKKCFPNPCEDPTIVSFPDPYDPSKFFVCNAQRQPIPYTCPAGMEFNIEFKICKKVSDPDCELCTQDGTFHTLDENNDSEFCVCEDGVATKIECPQDYAYNSALGTCYSNAPCDPTFCLEANEFDRSPNRNDSKSFCMCFGKKAVIMECPNNGTFNPYTLQCSDDKISPECLQSTCVGKTGNSYVFNPIDTKKSNGFCQCINQIATFRHCPYGSTLNPDLLICQQAEINCNSNQCRGLPDKTKIPSITSNEGYCECVAGDATYHNCPYNGEFNATTSKCEAPLCDLTQCTGTTNRDDPFPASTPEGFCLCRLGYVSCPAGTLFSKAEYACIDPCPLRLCNGRPDQYMASSLINKNSFCVCHARQEMSVTYEVCPSDAPIFDQPAQMCVANVKEMCGTDLCKIPGPFQAQGTLAGFCLCTAIGKPPTFKKCLEGIYSPEAKSCLPTAEDVCDVSLCAEATIDHPITLPANNSILEFCYCSSPTNAMLLPCPNGKYYSWAKGMCVNHIEDNNCCPNDMGEGQKTADNTTCNKFFVCHNGIMESKTCPDGDFFKDSVNDCVLDSEGVCVKKSDCTCLGIYYENEVLPHPVNPQMYYICKNNALHENKCQKNRIFSATQKQCISGLKMPQKRSVDLNVDHEFGCFENEKRSVPSNCSQYEICLQLTWKRRTCSNYRYYNPEQKKCLEPRDDFVCSYAKITSLPTCNTTKEYFLYKGKTCQQYYRCQEGKWRLQSCGRQQYFNEKRSTCLPVSQDSTFQCELLANSSRKEITSATNISTCHHLSQRYYDKNCAMYLICLDNDWWYQYCPDGMYYNRSLNYCVTDVEQQCKDVKQAEVILSAEEFSNDSCHQDGLLRPSAMACNRYFVCLNGKWQMQHCSSREFYDVANAKCSVDTEAICAQLHKDCLPNERRMMPKNCSLYEQCSNDGKWLIMTCPQDEMYDELLQQCVTNQGICSKYGVKRVCRTEEVMYVQNNCSTFYYCSQDTWSLGQCLKGFMYSKEKEMCIAHMPEDICTPFTQKIAMTSNESSNLCQGKQDGTSVAHLQDCTRYYICIHQSTSHAMQCSQGSFFDDSMGFCRPNDGSCRLPLTGLCANVSDESLVPHPSDCQAFFKCSSINGTELQHCPESQYFNNSTHQCLPDQGECKKVVAPKQKCAGLKHGSRLAHETYCNLYYACVKGLAIPVECPKNYQFNIALSKCVLDERNQCQNGQLVEGNITYSCGNLTDGSYLPDRRDCTRYYICSQGQALPKICASSSYYDSKLMLCMPDDGSCPFVNDENNLVPPDPAICEGKHGFLMMDPLNCNNFYACVHNKMKHEKCNSHHFFSSISQQCQPKLTAETAFNNNSTINDFNKSVAQCLDETTSSKKLCSELSEGTSLAEPGDCRRFITCQDSNEEPVSQRCRNGESFDSLLGFCRQNDGTCLLENGQRVGECSGKHGQLARDPTDCRNYFVCINGQKIAKTCSDDEYFSKTQNMCIKDTENVCSPTQPPDVQIQQSCAGLSESVLYPYVYDNCRSYFQCIKGVAKVHKCADDLFFDPLAIKCVKNKTECIMPTQTLQRSPAFSQTFSQLCSNKTLEYPYANLNNNCRSFYICHANGDVSHELCPLSLMFNKELLICTAETKTICT